MLESVNHFVQKFNYTICASRFVLVVVHVTRYNLQLTLAYRFTKVGENLVETLSSAFNLGAEILFGTLALVPGSVLQESARPKRGIGAPNLPELILEL